MAKRPKKTKVAGSGVSTKVPGTDAIASWPPSWLSPDQFWGLLLLVAVILVYQPVGQAGFIWDDDRLITANPCVVGPLGLKEIWTTGAADICPLTLTLFWVEHTLWGLWPLPYHVVNVLLHGACAVVLWRVLRNLQIPGAWLGATLWALHPVEVESVAWISEMKNTLSGLFFLLAILFFVKGLKTGDAKDRNVGRWNNEWTMLCAALAMTSKSSTVILPGVLCLCAWWVEGRWHGRNLVKIGPVFVMSIMMSSLSIWTQKLQGFTGNMDRLRSWPERLATAGDAVWFYLGKLLWPHPLITVYPRWEINAGHWPSYLPLLAVPILWGILWCKREGEARACFFTFTYFLVALLPVLGFINMSFFRYSFVADHFQYLASMGPLALLGAGLVRFSAQVLPEKRWQTIICAGLLLILGALSWQRSWVYKNEETLWIDTLAQNRNCWVGHNGLGHVLDQKGHVDEAIEQFQKAVEINPNDAQIRSNLGGAFLQKNQTDEAIEQFQKALEIKSNYADARNNLGVALLQKGQVDEAMGQFQKVLEIKPSHAQAHYNLGLALFQKGLMNEAMAEYQKALQLKPDYAEAQNSLDKVEAMIRQNASR